MTNEKYTEEFQKALNDYIKLGFNQDECNGFMHGFHKGTEAQKLMLPTVIKQIDAWIETSEMTAETFRKAGLNKEAQTFVDYAQAYWNVKQLIEVYGV